MLRRLEGISLETSSPFNIEHIKYLDLISHISFCLAFSLHEKVV